VLSSAEFSNSTCSKTASCIAERVWNGLVLQQPHTADELAGLTAVFNLAPPGEGVAAIVASACHEADDLGLYNAPPSLWG
jgi:hypothetical protein